MSFNRQRRGGIQACRYCVPPKRTETCHATCEEYIEAKKKYDEEQVPIKKELRNRAEQDDLSKCRKRRYLHSTTWRRK